MTAAILGLFAEILCIPRRFNNDIGDADNAAAQQKPPIMTMGIELSANPAEGRNRAGPLT